MKILNKKLKVILGLIGITVLMSFSSVNAQTCVQPPEGIVSWWPGDGDAKDISGTNDGTLQGYVTFEPGMVGQAFRLNGSGFISIPDNPTLDLTNEITIELWYNEDNISWFRGLVTKRCDNWSIPGCNTNYGINIHNYYGLGLYYQDPTVNGGDDWVYGSVYETSRYLPVPIPNQFHHLAGTYKQIDPTQIEVKTYIDGQLVKTLILPGNFSNTLNNEPLTIGASLAWYELFYGFLDEVTLYNRALSAEEINAIFNAGSAGKCKETAKEVSIDIKPGSMPNSINPKSSGKIPVAILSKPDFDASASVNINSLTFGHAGTETSLAFCNSEDVNGDGLIDLMCHFYTQQTGFQAGDTTGILKGLTTANVQIVGQDSVNIVGK